MFTVDRMEFDLLNLKYSLMIVAKIIQFEMIHFRRLSKQQLIGRSFNQQLLAITVDIRLLNVK